MVRVMREYQRRWKEYQRVLDKRAMDHPIQSVTLTATFAFIAGLSTICALFGRHFLHRVNIALAIYAVSASCLCVALLAHSLIRVLGQKKNSTDGRETS
jgi:purine-cytosine permease-like protein